MDGAAESRVDGRAADWTATVDPITTWAVSVEASADAARDWPGLRHEPFGLPDQAFKHDGKITKREVRAVLNNSFGFGGTNASLVMTKVQ